MLEISGFYWVQWRTDVSGKPALLQLSVDRVPAAIFPWSRRLRGHRLWQNTAVITVMDAAAEHHWCASKKFLWAVHFGRRSGRLQEHHQVLRRSENDALESDREKGQHCKIHPAWFHHRADSLGKTPARDFAQQVEENSPCSYPSRPSLSPDREKQTEHQGKRKVSRRNI